LVLPLAVRVVSAAWAWATLIQSLPIAVALLENVTIRTMTSPRLSYCSRSSSIAAFAASSRVS
jgi:hypothetical protein